jgi:ATP-dependent helicase/nuclease subunit A
MRDPGADLRRLASSGLSEHDLDPSLAEKAVETVEAVMKSDLWRRAQASTKSLVEVPFQKLLPVQLAVDDSLPTILRGVIDLVFFENGGWTVVDYKADARPTSELSKLVEHYRGQVEAYATFWQETTGQPVLEKGLYFTHSGTYLTV